VVTIVYGIEPWTALSRLSGLLNLAECNRPAPIMALVKVA
jgi:hypothetical protein